MPILVHEAAVVTDWSLLLWFCCDDAQ